MALKSRDVCKFCREYPHEREEMKIICDIFTASDEEKIFCASKYENLSNKSQSRFLK